MHFKTAVLCRTTVAVVFFGLVVIPSQSVRSQQGVEPPPRTPPRLQIVPASTPLPDQLPDGNGDELATPVDWPTVLELARASNLEIRMSREKINEAQNVLELSRLQWFPNLYMGTNWLHHEGRIQDIPGNIIDASKSSLQAGALLSVDFQPSKVCVDILRAKQQVRARQGEWDRVTRQTLQEASLAYIDLVASQGQTAIAFEVYQLFNDLERRSQELLKQGFVAPREVDKNINQLRAQEGRLKQARQQQLAAGSKLAILLTLPPKTRLESAERRLAPINLVDEGYPDEVLIDQASRQGPGLTEITALLSALDEQQRQARKVALIPNLSVNVGAGVLGGGFGGTYDNFNDQSDYGVRAYWDVARIIGGGKTQEVFDSKRRQANLQYEQIVSKLSHGVIVYRDVSRKAMERIRLAEAQIDAATRTYKLSREGLQAADIQQLQFLNLEVQQSIATLAEARANYLMAVIDYNKAQIQLQYLIGFETVQSLTPIPVPETKFENGVPLPSRMTPSNGGSVAPVNSTGLKKVSNTVPTMTGRTGTVHQVETLPDPDEIEPSAIQQARHRQSPLAPDDDAVTELTATPAVFGRRPEAAAVWPNRQPGAPDGRDLPTADGRERSTNVSKARPK